MGHKQLHPIEQIRNLEIKAFFPNIVDWSQNMNFEIDTQFQIKIKSNKNIM